MPRILTESNGYIGTHEKVKLCPHCLNTVAYSFLDLKVVGIGLNHKNYITCPNCQHEIIIEFTTTEHM